MSVLQRSVTNGELKEGVDNSVALIEEQFDCVVVSFNMVLEDLNGHAIYQLAKERR